MYKEKYIGESKLSQESKKKIGLKIADSVITTRMIKDGAVTEDKLSEEVRNKIDAMLAVYTLGFYTDEDPPMPIMMIAVRPERIDKVIVPYLLLYQQDMSDSVTDWIWQRTSSNTASDTIWNNSSKARQRVMHLTWEDFPQGWQYNNDVSFKCTVHFLMDGENQTLTNVILII